MIKYLFITYYYNSMEIDDKQGFQVNYQDIVTGLAPPQASGYQQAPPHAPRYQQAPSQAPGYQTASPQVPGYQQTPSQAPGYQQAPSQVTAYRQAIRQQVIEQQQLARQQMAPQPARDADVDCGRHPNDRGAQSPHGDIADQNLQREEQMRREQSRERSAPRDPRAGHPRDVRGQEQALPQAPRYHQASSSVPHHFQARVTPQPMREDQEHCQQLARDEDENARRRRHQEHRQQELRDSRHVNPAHGQEQQVHHPQHTHQNAEQGQLYLAAQLQGEDGMRRHQDRPVQIKQEPRNDELTIIAEFRGDGVAAARMESSRAQEFRKEQYMRREAHMQYNWEGST
ncbi:unnamed protein product [Caenorhabditis brenneri]